MAATNNIKKKVHASQEQKAALVDYMSRNSSLSSGKFSSTFTVEESKKMWAEVSAMLNAIPGAKKDWKHWRKTWHDMKSLAKGKQASLNSERRKTGGGPAPRADLTAVEEQVLCLIPSTSIHGLCGTEESSTQFEFPNDAPVVVNEEGSDEENEGVDVNIAPHSPTISTHSPTLPKTSRTVAGRRLQNSEKATAGLLEIAKAKLDLKREYFIEKLKVMERQAQAMERIANYLENK